jgi:hypothetical protein
MKDLFTGQNAIVRLMGALLCVSCVSGCALVGKHVNAYERSNLSKDGMALVQNSQESALINHMLNAREGSVGGFGGSGGGCGCN